MSKVSSIRSILVISCVMLVLSFINFTAASPYPSIDLFGGYDILGICLKNCAQCKKMFGNFFEGQLCADSCVKFKGKVVPDCEDLASIGPFLNKNLEKNSNTLYNSLMTQ